MKVKDITTGRVIWSDFKERAKAYVDFMLSKCLVHPATTRQMC